MSKKRHKIKESELKKVQRKLRCPRASLGSLSDAATVFDSALMQEIVAGLSDRLRPLSGHANADEIEVPAQNLEPGRIYVKDRGYDSDQAQAIAGAISAIMTGAARCPLISH